MIRIYTFLTLLLIFGVTFLSAQRPAWGGKSQGPSITGKITGTLTDSLTEGPVEFATIVLINVKTQKQVNGTITDEKGKFKMIELKMGEYDVAISFLGYQAKKITSIKLTPEKPDVNLGKVSLVKLQSRSGTMLSIQIFGLLPTLFLYAFL